MRAYYLGLKRFKRALPCCGAHRRARFSSYGGRLYLTCNCGATFGVGWSAL